MKIIYMQCGLGNQMFQYAFFKYLVKRGHMDIRLDASASSLHKHTEFDLYRLFPVIASSSRLLPYWKGRTLHLLSDVLKKGFGHSLETQGEGADKADIPKGKKWLRGYWQEARFADAVRDELLHDFAFTEPTDQKNLELLRQIDACEAVSVHVRAGDYLEPANRIEFGDICTPDYYRKAIGQIREKVKNPVFFVFSNNPALAEECLGREDRIIYVSHNTGLESYRDMQLMSRCRHHIIANSSFSWWGAWLNPAEDKLVYAPAKWFYNHEEEFTDGIIPPGWMKIGQSRPYVTLEADFNLSEAEQALVLNQSYRDFELIAPFGNQDKRTKPPGSKPAGVYHIRLRADEIPLFRNRKYLRKKLIKMHEDASSAASK